MMIRRYLLSALGSLLVMAAIASAGNAQLLCQGALKAVSYTHLTLPTNREV